MGEIDIIIKWGYHVIEDYKMMYFSRVTYINKR